MPSSVAMRTTCPSVTGLAASAKRQEGSSLRMVHGRMSSSLMIIAPPPGLLSGLLLARCSQTRAGPKVRAGALASLARRDGDRVRSPKWEGEARDDPRRVHYRRLSERGAALARADRQELLVGGGRGRHRLGSAGAVRRPRASRDPAGG